MVLPVVNTSVNTSCSRENVLKTLISKKGVMIASVAILCLFVMVPPEPMELRDSNSLKVIPEPVRLREDGYRLCQAFTGEEAPVFGEPMVKLPKQVAPMGIPYQCAGPDYEAFGDRLESLLETKAGAATHMDLWGKRTFPIPPHAAGTSSAVPPTFVLFFGSMGLRQVVTTMLCQYSHLIVTAKKIYASKRTNHGSFSIQVTLRGNVHIFIVLNPPFVYDHEHWQDLLERHVLNMPLAIMDLIVMSKFHTFSKKQGLAFEEFWLDYENDWTLPNTVHEHPISFIDLLLPSEHSEGAIVYTGPIVYVSTFASYGESEYQRAQQVVFALAVGQPLPRDPRDFTKVQKLEHGYEKAQLQAASEEEGLTRDAEDRLTYKAPPPKVHPHGRRRRRRLRALKGEQLAKRTNLVAINARHYVHMLGECATNQTEIVGTCLMDVNHTYYDKGERCIGTKGGHADLVVFDLIEGIYKAMWKPHK
jgi:hypothetical protein